MQPERACLRLVARSPSPRAAATRGGGDLALLVFVFALHLFPVVGALAGRPWGNATVGYATAMVLVTGREIARELRTRPAAHSLEETARPHSP